MVTFTARVIHICSRDLFEQLLFIESRAARRALRRLLRRAPLLLRRGGRARGRRGVRPRLLRGVRGAMDRHAGERAAARRRRSALLRLPRAAHGRRG